MTPHHLLWPLLCFVVFAFRVAQVAFLGWASPFLEPWHVCFVTVKPTRSVGDSAQLPSVVWGFFVGCCQRKSLCLHWIQIKTVRD